MRSETEKVGKVQDGERNKTAQKCGDNGKATRVSLIFSAMTIFAGSLCGTLFTAYGLGGFVLGAALFALGIGCAAVFQKL